MFFLSTVDHKGRPTVSYKGGAPGFVRIMDDGGLAFPDYDGQRHDALARQYRRQPASRSALHRLRKPPKAARAGCRAHRTRPRAARQLAWSPSRDRGHAAPDLRQLRALHPRADRRHCASRATCPTRRAGSRSRSGSASTPSPTSSRPTTIVAWRAKAAVSPSRITPAKREDPARSLSGSRCAPPSAWRRAAPSRRDGLADR